jgi:hypothetical protein
VNIAVNHKIILHCCQLNKIPLKALICIFNPHNINKTKTTFMKNLLFYSIVLLALTSCNQDSKTTDDSTAKKGDEAKATYEKNLGALKTAIAAFENEQIDAWATTVADSARWAPPAYGAGEAKKDDWKKALSMYMADWDSLKLVNGNFLPGVDSATHEFDGSVRYYGTWTGVHKSGVHTAANFYGAYDFNKDNKVVFGTEFFDVGGMMNAVQKK